MIDKFERIKLGHFPTPIEYLKNIKAIIKDYLYNSASLYSHYLA